MYQNQIVPILSLVNYSNLPTQASNEFYQAQTECPDSTSFLIKNGTIIEHSLIPDQQNEVQEKDKLEVISFNPNL